MGGLERQEVQREYESVCKQVTDQQSENLGPRERSVENEMDHLGQVT